MQVIHGSYDTEYKSIKDYNTLITILPVECIDLISYCEITEDSCLNVSIRRPILFCADSVVLYFEFLKHGNTVA